MERVLCLVMGYVFGLFQTGYLYSRSKHMDIRNYGSGNSGSTNVLRVMGKKAGLIVFLGDAGKIIVSQPARASVCIPALHRLWRDPGTQFPVLYGI